jgi:hypothetical protein
MLLIFCVPPFPFLFSGFLTQQNSNPNTRDQAFTNAIRGIFVSTTTRRTNKYLNVRELFCFYFLCFGSSPMETGTNNPFCFWIITSGHMQKDLYSNFRNYFQCSWWLLTFIVSAFVGYHAHHSVTFRPLVFLHSLQLHTQAIVIVAHHL